MAGIYPFKKRGFVLLVDIIVDLLFRIQKASIYKAILHCGFNHF